MSRTSNSERSGGEILADQLVIQGVDRMFCVPGESYLGLLDGLYRHRDKLEIVVARHEAGASNMADAYAKMTGRPAVCAVTRGPGATNAANGIHTAFQDSTPVILLIGQVGRGMADREAFQEIDYRRMYGQMAKWVAQIESAARVPEYISRAFHVAQSGRPGPVVLALPEDMLREGASVEDAPLARKLKVSPSAAQVAELRTLLEKSARPMVIAGGAGWTAQGVRHLARFAERNSLPVACSFRNQDSFDNRHANYAGVAGIGIDAKLRDRIRKSDLLLVLGPRLGEMTTQGYSLIDIPDPQMTLVHAHAGAEELGQVYAPDLAINCTMEELGRALAEMEPVDNSSWRPWLEQARADYLAWSSPRTMPGPVNLSEIIGWLSDTLPDDAIMANGSGNNSIWVHRFYRYRGVRSQIAATSGSMGYGVPAAIAAKLAAPDRTVVSVNGDGCFMMLGQELATAMQYGAQVIFIVVNNAMLATIRMHQERNFPGRVIATDLINPDFVALAKAYGAHAERVERTQDFAGAFERALAAGRAEGEKEGKKDGKTGARPALIELVIDAEALTPAQSLSEARAEGAGRNQK